MSSLHVVATAIGVAVVLGACGPKPAPVSFSGTENGSIVFAGNGSTYGLAVVDGVPTYAGAVAGGTATGPMVGNSGTASYTGLYEVAHFDAGDSEISRDAGNITLTADFAAASLTGTAGDLSIDADISGLTLGGTASYAGISGTLAGVIGQTRATGYFGGVADNSGFAGAFLASPPSP